jgi:hypothetical protein
MNAAACTISALVLVSQSASAEGLPKLPPGAHYGARQTEISAEDVLLSGM